MRNSQYSSAYLSYIFVLSSGSNSGMGLWQSKGILSPTGMFNHYFSASLFEEFRCSSVAMNLQKNIFIQLILLDFISPAPNNILIAV